MILVKKKVKKFRGSKTCGGGSKKKRRGKGSRGGVGRAGSHKHHYIREMKMGRRFGKYGFTRPPEVQSEPNTINVEEIELNLDRFMEMGVAKEDNDTVTVDLTSAGFDKLLGDGRVYRKFRIIVGSASERAIKKIESAGGEVELLR